MTRDVADLLSGLPDDLDPRPAASDEMASLLMDLSRRPAPTGRLTRAWSLGSVQARIVLAYLYSCLRGILADEQGRTRARDEFHATTAMRLLGTMGHLRGMVLKLGQTLANFPPAVPAEFIDLLGKLHFEAPPMHFSLLREMVRGELGDDPEQLFDEFETEAFAAASLGQVHRARSAGGDALAVKIQYPNIARTIEADFKNLTLAMAPLNVRRDWRDFRDKLEDARDTLLMETDYEREADHTERVRAALAGLDDVVVPRVHPSRSTRRVLTLDFVDGLHLDRFLAGRPSQELRDRHGAQILRASMRLFYEARLNLSDPHPGNFLFLPDGRLGMIDFGCMRPYEGEEWEFMWRGTEILQAGAPDDLIDELCVKGCRLTPEEAADAGRMAIVRRSTRWLWEPAFHEGPFDFGDEDYLRRGLDHLGEIFRAGFHRAMPLFTWSNRMFYGVRALLLRLGARVDMRAITLQEIERLDGRR